jgi:hypothetical protein
MKRIVIKLEIENDKRKGLPSELAEWVTEAYDGAYGAPPLRLISAYWEDASDHHPLTEVSQSLPLRAFTSEERWALAEAISAHRELHTSDVDSRVGDDIWDDPGFKTRNDLLRAMLDEDKQ